MEKPDFKRDEELLNYLDGTLRDAQAQQLKAHLEKSPALQKRLEELREVTSALEGTGKLAHPSSNFTHRVMSNLHRLPASATSLSPRNGLLLLCGILVAVGVLSMLLASDVFDGLNRSIELTNNPVTKDFVKNPLPSFSFQGKWLINGVVILALGLCFVLLDRTILRPLFNRRSKFQF